MSDEEKLDLIGCGVYIGSRWSKQNTITELENLKEEIEELKPNNPKFEHYVGETRAINNVLEVINKHIAKLKDKNINEKG